MKVKILVLVMALLLVLVGCGETRTVKCDNCGEDVKVEAGSNIEDSWIVYCEACYKKRFGEEGLVFDK